MTVVEWLNDRELMIEWKKFHSSEFNDENSAGLRRCELEMEKRGILPPRFLRKSHP